MERLRYIDLFCGIGGFRVATENVCVAIPVVEAVVRFVLNVLEKQPPEVTDEIRVPRKSKRVDDFCRWQPLYA